MGREGPGVWCSRYLRRCKKEDWQCAAPIGPSPAPPGAKPERRPKPIIII